MLSVEEIKKNIAKYKIKNGQVIDKSTNQPIEDENTVLNVKTSILLYRDAHSRYESHVQQFGNAGKTQEAYIAKSMERFGVNDQTNSYGENKLVNSILNSNGHYEEYISGSDLKNSKFSFLVAPKNDFGISYLRLKFQEKGLDIENFRIFLDTSELQHNGVSKVIIDFKVKKHEKKAVISRDENKHFSHPRAKELNALEERKKKAKLNNDRAAYISAQSQIESIIKETQVQVSPEQWDSMNIDERVDFFKLKMNEARVLHDEDSYNYWKANLEQLSKATTYSQPAYNSSPTTINANSVEDDKRKQPENKDYKYYMDEMIRLANSFDPNKNYSEEEKNQLIGEVFYNQGFLVQNLSSDEDFRVALTTVVNSLGGSNAFSSNILNSTISDMQKRYEQLHSKKENKTHNEDKENTGDLTKDIEALRKRLFWVQNEFHDMIADKHLDSDELAKLINMMKSIIDDGDLLRVKATNKKDKDIIAFMVDEMEQELNKMRKLQQKTEDVQRKFQ